ncbi:MAG: ABC transporter substrate-binding protein [Bacillota bacterium]
MSRLLAACLVCTAFLAVVIGPAAGAVGKTELTFWSWRTEDIDAYGKFIKVFEAKNPDIAVKFIPYKNTEYNTILATALQGGTGPDIAQLRSYGGMEALAAAGYLVPLDTTTVPGLAKFPKDILKGATNRHDGKVYGVPFAIQTIQVLYNKAIFDKLGLKEPATWDEFLKLGATLKEEGYIPLANGGKDGWTLETLFGGVAPNFYGGNDFADAVIAGKTTFNDPRFIHALKKMLELRPYMPPSFMGVGYTDMQMMFAQEMAAMMIAGSYEVGTFERLNPNIKIGVFPVPGEKAGDGGYVAVYVDGSYGINAASKHREQALRFINFVATVEYGQMFADELSQPSAVPGVKPKHPVLAEMLSLAEKKSTPHLMLVGFRFEQPSGSTLLQTNLQGMFSDKLTAEQVAAEIQSGLARWYKPFQK